MSAYSSFSDGSGMPTRAVILPVVLSMMAHGVLLAVMVIWPTLRPRRPILPPVIQVQMVSLKDFGAQETAKPIPRKSKATEKAVVAPRSKPKPKPKRNTPAPEVSLSKKTKADNTPEMKTALKKKTFEPTRAVEEAIERLERQMDDRTPPPDPLASALDRLKDTVETQAEQRDTIPEPGGDAPPAPGSSRTGPSGQGREALEQLDLYRLDVAFEIQRHWAFSESLAGGRTDLMAEVAFRVMPNGEIKDIWFDRRSGNAYLDASARKAILKANPVRAHPVGLNRPFVQVGLRFTPSGIR